MSLVHAARQADLGTAAAGGIQTKVSDKASSLRRYEQSDSGDVLSEYNARFGLVAVYADSIVYGKAGALPAQ